MDKRKDKEEGEIDKPPENKGQWWNRASKYTGLGCILQSIKAGVDNGSRGAGIPARREHLKSKVSFVHMVVVKYTQLLIFKQFLTVEFSSAKYVHIIVQPSPPSISRIFFIFPV